MLANLDPDSNVATPQTLAWAVAAGEEQNDDGAVSGLHVFRPGWKPGDPDIWLREGLLGIEQMSHIHRLRSSHTRLSYGGAGGPCVGLDFRRRERRPPGAPTERARPSESVVDGVPGR